MSEQIHRRIVLLDGDDEWMTREGRAREGPGAFFFDARAAGIGFEGLNAVVKGLQVEGRKDLLIAVPETELPIEKLGFLLV